MKKFLAALVLMATLPPATAALPDSSAAPTRYAVEGRGYITDARHPQRPGDFARGEVDLRLVVDVETREALLDIATRPTDAEAAARYFIADGEIFQRDADGRQIAAAAYGDLSAATLAALHSSLVWNALQTRAENYRGARRRSGLFAWNDELWTVETDRRFERLRGMERAVVHELFGDGAEKLSYAPPGAKQAFGAQRVSVTALGRETARIDFAAPVAAPPMDWPFGDRQHYRDHVVAAEDIVFEPLVTGVYSIDLPALDMRVIVAEFADHLVVLEGAYSSSVCDTIARKIRERFAKPVRYFAFSHLHGQYVGGVRSWIAAGATILVPPSTAQLIESLAKAKHHQQPDTLSTQAKSVAIETVAKQTRVADAEMQVDVYNVASGHTDEYLIFHFPKQKLLITGDLLIYRPGQPLSARAKQACATLKALKLDVETYVSSWPLHGYGTKSVATAAEMAAACTESTESARP